MVKTSELILLYLYDHIDEQLAGECSTLFSYPGMQENLGLSKSSLSEDISSLTKEGLIEERRKYVADTGRYRNFYFLTQEGIVKARELREEIGKKKIKVRKKDELKEMRILGLLEYLEKITKKPIEKSYSYIIIGEKLDKAYEVFKDLIGKSHTGIVISAIPPKKLEKNYKIKEEIFWLSEAEGKNILRPDRLDFELMATISNFLKENEKPVILLEGFEYLSQINSFDTCLRWIKTVTDVVAKNEGVLIMSINPDILSEKELSSLSQTMEVYEPRKITPIGINYTNILKNITPEGLLDIRTILEPKKYVDYSERKPELRYFFGREKELGEINDFLYSKSSILCIRGIAGIGKTTLLSKFLEGIEMNVFWHRFYAFSTLRNLLIKLGDFLSKMGRGRLANYLGSGRLEIEEILILLDEEIKASNTLLVFDDAQKAGKEIVDFFALLKDLKTDLKLVFLGREIPHFYDRRDVVVERKIREMTLGGLDRNSSEKLLRHRKIEEEIDRLYNLTRGHPLMLELLTPATMTEVTEYIKEEIAKKLKSDERICLELASVFRFPFPARAIVDGTNHDTIDSLVDKSLMQRSLDMYDVHGTIREFFYNRLAEDQKIKYHEIVSEYYRKELGDGALLETIYHLLKAEKQEKAAELMVKNGRQLIDKGLSKELNELVNAFSKNQVSEDKWVRILSLKSKIYKHLGEWDNAITQAKKCINLSKQLNDEKQEGEGYRLTGEILVGREEHDDAQKNLQKALKIFEHLKEKHSIAETHYWLGTTYWKIGKLDDAIASLRKCLNISKEIGDRFLIGKSYGNIGIVYHYKGDYDKSIELYIKDLSISEPVGDKYEIINTYNNLGVSYEQKGEINKAIEWYEKTIEVGKEMGYSRFLGYGLSNAAENYAKKGELDKALEYTDKAKEIFEKLGEKRLISACHRNYGIIYKNKKEWNKSKRHFEEGIKIAKEIESFGALSQTYYQYGLMYKERKDSEKAKEQFKHAIEIYEKLGNKEKVEEVRKEMEKL